MAITVLETRSTIIGSYREKYFRLNIGANGDTLITGLHVIKWADTSNPGGVTNDQPTGGTLTFTVPAPPVTNVQVRAVGL